MIIAATISHYEHTGNCPCMATYIYPVLWVLYQLTPVKMRALIFLFISNGKLEVTGLYNHTGTWSTWGYDYCFTVYFYYLSRFHPCNAAYFLDLYL